jgi:hypothetical protein
MLAWQRYNDCSAMIVLIRLRLTAMTCQLFTEETSSFTCLPLSCPEALLAGVDSNQQTMLTADQNSVICRSRTSPASSTIVFMALSVCNQILDRKTEYAGWCS